MSIKHWSERALGLPENSVKAIALFTILGLVVYLSIFDKTIPEFVKTLVGMMVGFYFAKTKPSEEKKRIE